MEFSDHSQVSHGVWHPLSCWAKLWFSQCKSVLAHQSSVDKLPESAGWSGLEAKILCFPCKPKVCSAVDQLPEDKWASQTCTFRPLSCFSLCCISSPLGTLHRPVPKVNVCYTKRSSREISLKKADQSITQQFREISLAQLYCSSPPWYLSFQCDSGGILFPGALQPSITKNSFCVVCAKPVLDCTQAFLTAGDFLLCQMTLFPKDLLTTTLAHAVRVDLEFPEHCPLSDITWWVSYPA